MDANDELRAKLKRLLCLPRWKVLLFIFILDMFVLLNIVYICQMKTIYANKEKLMSAEEPEGRDMNGDLWKGNTLIEKCKVKVPEGHFFCIVCQEAVPFTIDSGFAGSVDVGGYACNWHNYIK